MNKVKRIVHPKLRLSHFQIKTYYLTVSDANHPRRPRGSLSVGSGEKAGRKFSSTGKRAPGYRLSPNYFQKFKRMPALIGHKKCFVLLCPIGEQFLLSSFRELYATATVSITASLVHAPKKCSQPGNFQFHIKSPSDFKSLSARKLKDAYPKTIQA